MIQAVVYDIGNVLIGWQPEVFYDRLYGRAERERLFATVDLHAMNDAIDRGADFRDTVEEWKHRHPELADHIRHWHDDWVALTGPVIDHSLALLRALRRRGVPVFALSNFGIGTFALARQAYPFLDEFDRRYLSGYMAMAKPDPAIYAAVEADSGRPPGTLLFVDDRPENIAAATARGWQGHVFDGPAGWAARLVREGLLNAEEAKAT